MLIQSSYIIQLIVAREREATQKVGLSRESVRPTGNDVAAGSQQRCKDRRPKDRGGTGGTQDTHEVGPTACAEQSGSL